MNIISAAPTRTPEKLVIDVVFLQQGVEKSGLRMIAKPQLCVLKNLSSVFAVVTHAMVRKKPEPKSIQTQPSPNRTTLEALSMTATTLQPP